MRADIPAATIARLTLSIMDGLQLQWLASEGRLDMAGEFEAYVDHLKGTWGAPADRSIAAVRLRALPRAGARKRTIPGSTTLPRSSTGRTAALPRARWSDVPARPAG